MLASGSRMLLGSEGERNAANVVGMVCINPRDGGPARALLCQLFTAFGLPADSLLIRFRTPAVADSGSPSIRSACCTVPAQRAAPPAEDATATASAAAFLNAAVAAALSALMSLGSRCTGIRTDPAS